MSPSINDSSAAAFFEEISSGAATLDACPAAGIDWIAAEEDTSGTRTG